MLLQCARRQRPGDVRQNSLALGADFLNKSITLISLVLYWLTVLTSNHQKITPRSRPEVNMGQSCVSVIIAWTPCQKTFHGQDSGTQPITMAWLPSCIILQVVLKVLTSSTYIIQRKFMLTESVQFYHSKEQSSAEHLYSHTVLFLYMTISVDKDNDTVHSVFLVHGIWACLCNTCKFHSLQICTLCTFHNTSFSALYMCSLRSPGNRNSTYNGNTSCLMHPYIAGLDIYMAQLFPVKTQCYTYWHLQVGL